MEGYKPDSKIERLAGGTDKNAVSGPISAARKWHGRTHTTRSGSIQWIDKSSCLSEVSRLGGSAWPQDSNVSSVSPSSFCLQFHLRIIKSLLTNRKKTRLYSRAVTRWQLPPPSGDTIPSDGSPHCMYEPPHHVHKH